MNYAKIVREEICKMWFYEVRKTCNFRQSSLFFTEKANRPEHIFCQMVFFFLNIFVFHPLVDGRRKLKNNFVLHKNEQVSVMKYHEQMSMKKKREISSCPPLLQLRHTIQIFETCHSVLQKTVKTTSMSEIYFYYKISCRKKYA